MTADEGCRLYKTRPGSHDSEAPGSYPSKLSTRGVPGATIALALLLELNLINYIDRTCWRPRSRQSRSGFCRRAALKQVVVGCPDGCIPDRVHGLRSRFGWLADRAGVVVDRHRRPDLELGQRCLWIDLSLARDCRFLAAAVDPLFVGIGEAAYAPVAPADISDLYPERMRGTVLAWFYVAIPVGSALGYVLGGQAGFPLGILSVVPPGSCWVCYVS